MSGLVTALLYLLGAVVTLAATVIGVVCALCSDLIKQEASTRLERFPHWLLERAAGSLPESCREQIYEEHWLPEMQYISRSSEGLPLTRFCRSTSFALRLMGGPAKAVGDALKTIRPTAPADTEQPQLKFELVEEGLLVNRQGRPYVPPAGAVVASPWEKRRKRKLRKQKPRYLF